MSSSDDSDEDNAHLKEAVDATFLNDFMFDKSKAVNASTSDAYPGDTLGSELKPSLRKCSKEQQLNDLNVTPEFQKFVAKHLSVFLDKNVKEVEQIVHADEDAGEPTGGIRLLSGSSCVIEHNCERAQAPEPAKRRTTAKKRRKRDRSGFSSSSEYPEVPLEELASVAVTPEWVLTQKGTQGWSVSTKGEVITGLAAEVNGLDKAHDVGVSHSSTDADKVAADSDLKTLKKEKKKQKKLKNSLENGNVGVLDSSAVCDKVAADSDHKRLKKSEKRKRQKLKKKLALQNKEKDI